MLTGTKCRDSIVDLQDSNGTVNCFSRGGESIPYVGGT